MSTATVGTVKWTSTAGPRKQKPVVALLNSLKMEWTTFISLTGVKGKPETESRSVLTAFTIGGAGRSSKHTNSVAIEEWNTLGERYGWELTNANLALVEADVRAALERARAGRPVNDERISLEADDERTRSAQARDEKARQEAEECARITAQILAKRPHGAEALILASLDQDDSDTMSDYFNSKTLRRVAIGWRFGSREDFRQLREAAAKFPETAHLGPDADSSVEHRDNYSMGRGNYLKDGGTHSNGWRVKSQAIHNGTLNLSWGTEDALPEVSAAPNDASLTASGAGVTISINEELHGIEIRFSVKPSSDLIHDLKMNRWRWSRKGLWYNRHNEENLAWAQQLVGRASEAEHPSVEACSDSAVQQGL